MRKLLTPIQEFISHEAFSGVLLALCTVAAILLANSSMAENYFYLLKINLAGLSLHHWVNDGLMVIFFFVVGMEIKKELLSGELSSAKKAALPFAAALGGMILPAFIYYWLNPQYPQSKGWGIPMATDIAFAVAVLSFFRVPFALKVFLLALAIVDDLGAIVVIALFYTKEIHWWPLLGALGIIGVIFLSQRWRISAFFYYLALGIAVWLGVLLSGIHATIAGVLLGFLTPNLFERDGKSYSPLQDLVHILHPWVSYLIMPIFALANAGVVLSGLGVELVQHSIHQGVAIGLFLGKPVGIFVFSFISVKLGLAQLPNGVRWGHILAVGFLGGIGFTMALFISSLALYPDQEIFSKTGILLGSMAAALSGSAILFLLPKRT